MIQGSEEWLLWRASGLGASDAAAIMGVSPYQTAYQLYEEKLGLKTYPRNEFITGIGHDFEKVARARFEIETDIIVEPLCAEHKDIPWLRASLDAASAETFAEIKFMGSKNLEIVRETNLPLEHHYPQIQQQLAVTGFPKGYYVVYSLDKEYKEITNYLMIEVFPDLKYIEDELYPKLKEFWGFIQSKTPPPMVKKDLNRIKREAKLQNL